MRSSRHELLVASMFVLAVASPCFAQSPPGPATLENLVNSGEKPAAVAAPQPETPDTSRKRPAGALARPKDGVQHPDLDKAWTEYDTTVTKAARAMRAAVAQQFDAVAGRGDLEAAEKWQALLEKFDTAGELPDQVETKATVSGYTDELKNANNLLDKAYDAVVKSLTMGKKIVEARAVRDEQRFLKQHDPVVGRWRWFVDGRQVPEAEFLPGGRVAGHPDASWLLVDPKMRRYQFAWGKEFLDVMTLSPDGAVLSGKNNHNIRIEGRRIGAGSK